MQVGAFLVALVVLILLAIFVYSVIDTLVGFPSSLKRYREVRSSEKGYVAITRGMSAVAAGDTAGAMKSASKARQLMPNDTGLTLLLEAQAARLDGRGEDVRACFTQMLDDPDVAFLGMRGLLQEALEGESSVDALATAHRALIAHPKQPWVMQTVYDLEAKAGHWGEALAMLKRLEKARAMDDAHVLADRAALLFLQGREKSDRDLNTEAIALFKKSLKIDAGFVPAVLALVDILMQDGKRRAAVLVLEKAWARRPYPEFARLWGSVLSKSKRDKMEARLAWFERLIALAPDDAEGHVAYAREAASQNLWGVARSHLETAEVLGGASQGLYAQWIDLEERSGGSDDLVQSLTEKMAEAPAGPVWICRDTGRVFDGWQPFADSRSPFNTIVWGSADILFDALELEAAG